MDGLGTVLDDVRSVLPGVLLVLLLLADTATTELFLERGGVEANPLFMRFNIVGVLAEDWFGRFVVASVAGLLFIVVERSLKEGNVKNKTVFQVLSLVFWWTLFVEALTVLWNLSYLI